MKRGVSRRLLPIAAALALSMLFAAADTGSASGGYRLVYTPARQVNCTYSATWQVTGQTVTGWTYFQLVPPATGRQRITMNLQPNGYKGSTQGNDHLPLMYLKTVPTQPQQSSQLSFTITYQGQLCATKLVALRPGEPAPRVPALSAKQRQFYTQVTSSLDYNSPTVQAWLSRSGLRRRAGESDLDLGRRVVLAMRSGFKYNLNHPSQQKASDCVRDRVGVCGSLSWVFAAAMRANGVPARVLSLLKADQDYNVGGSELGHATNEFYCAGIGWVPADLTGVVCASSDQEALNYYAQDADGGFLITFNGDDDFTVDMDRLGPGITRPGKPGNGAANGDNIVYGIPWGICANGGSGGSMKSTDQWVTKVSSIESGQRSNPISGNQGTGNQGTSNPASSTISAVGRPPVSIVDHQAGYLVWRDSKGWHVHCNLDHRTHEWQIDIRPILSTTFKLSHAGSVGTGPDLGDSLYAVGSEDDRGLTADVRAPASVKSLLFILSLDGKDAPDKVWIGKQGVHPADGEFILSNVLIVPKPRSTGG